MKIKIDRNQKSALQKSCIELRFTVQFHDDEMNDETVIAYIRDEQLGELTPSLAFHLGMHFRCVLQDEIYQKTEIYKSASR